MQSPSLDFTKSILIFLHHKTPELDWEARKNASSYHPLLLFISGMILSCLYLQPLKHAAGSTGNICCSLRFHNPGKHDQFGDDYLLLHNLYY